MNILTRAALLPRDSGSSLDTRFARAQRLPAYQDAMVASPDAPSGIVELLAPIAMGVFGVYFFREFRAHASGDLARFGLLVIVAWSGALAWLLTSAIRYQAAPLERIVVVVIDERTAISGGRDRQPIRTRYHVTLQRDDGQRFERVCPEHLSRLIVPGDLGVAYVKHDRLVDFARLEA